MGKRGRDSTDADGVTAVDSDAISSKKTSAEGDAPASTVEADAGAGTDNGGGAVYPMSELRHPPATSGQFIKIITWNVAGLRGTLKKSPKILEELAAKYNADFICLQEIKITEDQIPEVEAAGPLLPGYKEFWCCSLKKGYAGTAFFVNKATVDCSALDRGVESAPKPKKAATATLTSMWGKKKVPAADAEPAPVASATSTSASSSSSSSGPKKCRLLKVDFDFKGTQHSGEGRTIVLDLDCMSLIGCYVPNSGQNLDRLPYRINDWETHMRGHLQELDRSKPVVYCGDLNVAHLDADIYNYDAKHIVKQSGCTPQERAAFGEMLSCGFVDAFRHLYPDATGHFTYWSQRTFARNVNKGLRLDYFVCSNRMTTPSGSHPHIFDCYTLPSDTIGASDHCPVMLILKQ